MNSSNTKTRTAPVPARGKLHGMKVVFRGGDVQWHILDRHPARGHWWLHRRDALGAWVTTFARYSDLEQVIE